MRRLAQWILPLLGLWLLGLWLSGCGDSGLRDWRPDDHGQVPGPPPGMNSQPAEPVSAADALWGAHCARCHGAEGAGGGAMAPGPMPDLTNPAWVAQANPEAVGAIIRQGRGMMPGFADLLSPQAVDELTRRLLERRDPAAGTPTPPGTPATPEGPLRDPAASESDATADSATDGSP